MNSIGNASHNREIISQSYSDEVMTLDKVMSESTTDLNLGFLMMYEEWKQKILLSNGIDNDENADW